MGQVLEKTAARSAHWVWRLALLFLIAPGAASACDQFSIGLNKFDLALQYIGRASGGDGSAAYTQVTRAMARKAISDAALAGVTYFRISASGFKPHDLDLWVKNPTLYWAALDQMMADLHAAGICVVPVLAWNPVQFPTMASESISAMLTDPKSASWQLLERYVRDFIGHYSNSSSLLFYELTNELNNHVDIDGAAVCSRKKSAENCAAVSNFSTDQMNAFTARFASLIRSLDSSHKISSGFSLPRPAAQHLRHHPQWLGRADWTPDSREELEENLRDIHRSVDIISVHLYPPNSTRLGLTAGAQYRIAEIVQAAAARIGKPLFIGEFGQTDIRQAGPESFIARMTQEIPRLRVPFSAVWIWEFYQVAPDAPYQSEPSSFSLEPGYTDSLIDGIRQANASGRTRPAGELPDRPPEVVLTEPMECAALSGGSELFAVASSGAHAVEVVDFFVDGKSVGQVRQPPYRLSLPALDARGVVEIEARACSAGKCGSYRTRVVASSNAAAGAQCTVRALR
jgi:hypothetical protein